MKEEEIIEKNIWIAEGIRIGRKQLAKEMLKELRLYPSPEMVINTKKKLYKENDSNN